MADDYLIEVDDCIKRYGGVVALKGVSLRVRKGSVHGLLGENGAGKSTLVKIIAGIVQATSGTMRFNGEEIVDADVKAMEEKGVFLVTQEPMIVEPMTVADNLMLGRWPARSGFVRDRHMMALATSFLEEANLDPRRLASTLSVVEKRKLNILRALHSGGKLIILDEPTTALTMADKHQLFTFMKQLRAQSVSFLFISHYNEEILEICDEVSVLRDGQMIGQGQVVSHLDSSALSEMVIGRDVHLFKRVTDEAKGDVVWTLRDVRASGLSVDRLDIRKGEIIGFAGLPGSGAKELGRAIYGLMPSARGFLDESGVAHALPRDPAEALRTGIAFLSEDRLRDGIIAIQSIAENMTLSSLPAVSRFGWVSRSAERQLVEKFWRLFAVKAASHAAPLGSLSGGNQQKVLLSRLVATEPRLVILNEPTRGIDVGVKEEVHRLVDDLSHRGVSVIIITSDIEEMLRIVDRVALFVDGRISAIEPAHGLTKEDVFEMAYSASDRSVSASHQPLH
ncbi:sugar ABC transporter ATP-binding protein [Acidisoma silvae]|uniref:Sugar ABC transporter ATP-binding protein n=1 Tax=Acidisoma silvae TaxID=2802396 RepID=A0A963YWL4_9PROT|nr:sugar ABC transporter ATP-binding protein [Acidisoma silvae]MCB8877692.1 sugar ABC transporter ATP-binding protein [Acidisoma silvae]